MEWKKSGITVEFTDGTKRYVRLGLRATAASGSTVFLSRRYGTYSVTTFLAGKPHKVGGMTKSEFLRRFPKLANEALQEG